MHDYLDKILGKTEMTPPVDIVLRDGRQQRTKKKKTPHKGAVTRLETRAHRTAKTEAAGDSLQGAEGNNCQLYI